MWRNELISSLAGKLAIAAFGLIVLTGCTGPKSLVYFEILEPAEVTYPENVNRIGFLNRSPLSAGSFSGFSDDFDPLTLRIVDTIVCNNLKNGFFDGRKSLETSYMDSILFLDFRRKDTASRMKPLPDLIRESIFNERGLDAIIILDYYTLDIARSYSHYSLSAASFIEEYRLVMEVSFRTVVRDLTKPIDEIISRDTLFFLNESSRPSSSYVSASDVVRSGAYEVGYAYGRRHIPVWNEVSRVVWRGREEELRLAASYTDRGDWDQALTIWSGLLSSDDPKLAAKAAHNVAVYFELDDDVETALKYAERAAKLWKNYYTELYRKELTMRNQNKEELLKQIR